MADRFLGILPGEGVGSELVRYCQEVVELLCAARGLEMSLAVADPLDPLRLTDSVEQFVREALQGGGAILSGPGGGRYVYELRQKLDLFYKLNPIRSVRWDVLIARETTLGAYQSVERRGEAALEVSYTVEASRLRRFLDVAGELAARRQGRLSLACKTYGQPLLSQLWRELAEESTRSRGVQLEVLESDYCAYLLVHEPQHFDVIACCDDLGDILSDLGGHLLGSRGMTFGASFGEAGGGVYQTNHGAARDLVGKDCANPACQLGALAYLLERDWGRADLAQGLQRSIATTFQRFRTPDMQQPSTAAVVSTSDWMAELLKELAR